MAKSGVNNTLLKQRNRGLILKLIATGQCSSRIELSQKTGLAKMTVTYIVNEFLDLKSARILIKLKTFATPRFNPWPPKFRRLAAFRY